MKEYIQKIVCAIENAKVTIAPYGHEQALEHAIKRVAQAVKSVSKIMVIGNGGSAGVASHVATDLMRAGHAAMTLTDPAMLTCLSNDIGYADAFSEQILRMARHEDMLLAISSSGASQNILRACHTAKRLKLEIVTFSGFSPTNELRILGDINFYVPSSDYGTVEMAHHVILHALTDEVLAERAAA